MTENGSDRLDSSAQHTIMHLIDYLREIDAQKLKREAVEAQVHAVAEDIIRTKSKDQIADTRHNKYIRRVTDSVPVSSRIGDISLTLQEVVMMGGAFAKNGEETALVDRYSLTAQLPGSHDYKTVFSIPVRSGVMTDWSGKMANLAGVQMALDLLQYMDGKLPPKPRLI